jgi:hypothetical protein
MGKIRITVCGRRKSCNLRRRLIKMAHMGCKKSPLSCFLPFLLTDRDQYRGKIGKRESSKEFPTVGN